MYVWLTDKRAYFAEQLFFFKNTTNIQNTILCGDGVIVQWLPCYQKNIPTILCYSLRPT